MKANWGITFGDTIVSQRIKEVATLESKPTDTALVRRGSIPFSPTI